MSARWYKRCGADFIHGTMMLTLEEKGAYSLCLDLIYDRGGPIPDDARWLSGVCGVSLRKWNALRQRLLDLGKIYAENGLLSNARADFEIVSAELSSRKLAESGAKGGRKRAENAACRNENNDLAQATLKPKEKIREEEKEPPKPPVKKRGEGKHILPEDWVLPALSDLPPNAQACARQWTPQSYATHGEAFVCYWRSKRGMNADWRLTWANRVVAIHSQVMRDQKFGNAPTAPVRAVPSNKPKTAQDLELAADFWDSQGQPDKAQQYRAEAAALRPKSAAGSIGDLVARATPETPHTQTRRE